MPFINGNRIISFIRPHLARKLHVVKPKNNNMDQPDNKADRFNADHHPDAQTTVRDSVYFLHVSIARFQVQERVSFLSLAQDPKLASAALAEASPSALDAGHLPLPPPQQQTAPPCCRTCTASPSQSTTSTKPWPTASPIASTPASALSKSCWRCCRQ